LTCIHVAGLIKVVKAYLVVGESDFDFEVGRHHELVGFDRVVVVLLLIWLTVAIVLVLHVMLLVLELLLRNQS
jgi:hypothetical protein